MLEDQEEAQEAAAIHSLVSAFQLDVPATRRGSGVVVHQELPEKRRRTRILLNKQADVACQACKRAKKRCGDTKPCARCVSKGIKCVVRGKTAAQQKAEAADQVPSNGAEGERTSESDSEGGEDSVEASGSAVDAVAQPTGRRQSLSSPEVSGQSPIFSSTQPPSVRPPDSGGTPNKTQPPRTFFRIADLCADPK